MQVVLRKSSAKEPFSFVFEADGKMVAKSENYSQKQSALNGIESVKKNSSEDSRYELKESTNGKFYFNLKATNGQVVATSTMFDTQEIRTKAIENFKEKANKAKLIEQ